MGEGSRQRLDKWLWFARVVKSRTLAARLVEGGYVRVNGQRAASASKAVGIGDVLTVSLDRHLRILRVVSPGQRRGPFVEACGLFEEIGGSGTAHSPVVRGDACCGALATSEITE